MPLNVGIDIGTTYTTLTYQDNDHIVVYQSQIDNTTLIKSLVAYHPLLHSFSFAQQAQTDSYEPKYILFKGFKMLLNEQDQQLLEENHYTDFTPENILSRYVTYVLSSFLRDFHYDHIDKLYVGFPEIWKDDLQTMSAKNQLLQVIAHIQYKGKNVVRRKDDIQLVSEPEAACACFVIENDLQSAHNFQGHCLVIDYGGGTLDIALCHVHFGENISDVSVIDRSGKGANSEKRIGKAGLAFFDELAYLAIEEVNQGKIVKDHEFYKVVDRLERSFIGSQVSLQLETFLDVFLRKDRSLFYRVMNDIELVKAFERDVFSSYVEDNEKYLVSFEYQGRVIHLHYWMAVAAYKNVIFPALQEELDYMSRSMREKGIDYGLSCDNRFKIIMVGGFSQFILTRLHVKYYLHILPTDIRFENLKHPQTAIAYGLGYFASGKISFKREAPHGIGIVNYNNSSAFYAFHEGDVYQIGEPQYITDKNGNLQHFASVEIPKLVFEYRNRNGGVQKRIGEPPTKELKEKLILKKDLGQKVFSIGFSFDQNGVLFLHKIEYAVIINDQTYMMEYKEVKKDIVELTDMYHWFGGTIENDLQ